MKSVLAQRAARKRSASLHTVPPPLASADYDQAYADIAASILYKSPCPSQSGLPVYVLNAAAFPDSYELDYDSLLPYVLARLPGEDELIAGAEYEVVFFAGGQPETAAGEKKSGPGVGWYISVYQVLSRALRKRLQKIYIVHERSWVRVLTEVLATIASSKFKRKVFHVGSLTALGLHIPIDKLLIPPAVYLHDRKLQPDIFVPYVTGKRAFCALEPLPTNRDGAQRLPRVLRETTSFLLQGRNLDTEGIFRIPPHSVLLGILREAYDRGQRFIVWREGEIAQVDPGMHVETLAAVHESDAYGVHLAAGLIKTWYRELKSPVFPERCYDELRQKYGALDPEVSLSDLTDLFSPSSTTSPLSDSSRTVITQHLLPLLSEVASRQASNKMSADNLAICFSPALLRSPDAIQDAKMSSVIRKLLSQAINRWTSELSQACSTSPEKFKAGLSPPADAAEYEDPLRHDGDNEHDETERAPPLPPRAAPVEHNQRRSPATLPPIPKRKPAPTPATLPRYSTLITDHSPVGEDTGAPPYAHTEQRQSDGRDTFPAGKSRQPLALHTSEPFADSASSRSPSNLSALSMDDHSPASPLLSPSLEDIQRVQLRSVSGETPKSADDSLFVKPTWAASSRKGSASSAASHRKPTPPLILPKNVGLGGTGRGDSGSSTSQYVPPKPRTPSPGLLQRMQSWEKEASDDANGVLRPTAATERKQSVDDLRRVYEERAGTVASLAPLSRTPSNASTKSTH